MRIAPVLTAIAVCAAALLCAARPADAIVTLRSLDYESGNFRQWAGVNALRGRATVVRSPRHQGNYAARFIVRPGDNPLPGASGERAEAYAWTRESEGKESWWKWSTYFPTGFRPNTGSAWNVFTQWHQTAHTCPSPVAFEVNAYGSPWKLRLHVDGGSINLSTCQPASERTWNFAALRRNKWYTFVFHVRWSAKRSVGFVQLWVNGNIKIRKTYVPTLYAGQGVNVRQGFYRGKSSKTTVIYHDGLRRFRPS